MGEGKEDAEAEMRGDVEKWGQRQIVIEAKGRKWRGIIGSGGCQGRGEDEQSWETKRDMRGRSSEARE